MAQLKPQPGVSKAPGKTKVKLTVPEGKIQIFITPGINLEEHHLTATFPGQL